MEREKTCRLLLDTATGSVELNGLQLSDSATSIEVQYVGGGVATVRIALIANVEMRAETYY